MKRLLLLVGLLMVTCISIFSQKSGLRDDIGQIIKDKQATVGVALIVDGKDTLTINNDIHYPTQSVYKFHLALAVLDYLDSKALTLDHKLFIKKNDLIPDTYSPLRDDYPEGEMYLTIADVIRYTVSKSDNNGCDILFRFLGGPTIVDQYIRELGVVDFSIAKTEEEMHSAWDIQYLNWSTAYAAALVLEKFRTGAILSDSSHDFLWNTLVETTTGRDKIKAGLPQDVILAHKTGSSARNKDGLSAAENDVGIVQLPDGRFYTLVVFVSDSMEDQKTNAAIIAAISKAVYESLTAEQN